MNGSAEAHSPRQPAESIRGQAKREAAPSPKAHEIPNPQISSPNLLTVAEAAWRLRVSEKTVRRMIAAGELEAVRIRRSVRVTERGVERLMRAGDVF